MTPAADRVRVVGPHARTHARDAELAAKVAYATSATCFNTIRLPAWGSAEELAHGMRMTLEHGGGFGMA